jgi:hypothetical protein
LSNSPQEAESLPIETTALEIHSFTAVVPKRRNGTSEMGSCQRQMVGKQSRPSVKHRTHMLEFREIIRLVKMETHLK